MYVYQHLRKKPFFFQNEIETCVSFHVKEKLIQNISIWHRNDKFHLNTYVTMFTYIYFIFLASKKCQRVLTMGYK